MDTPTKLIPHSLKYRVRHYPKSIRNLLSRKAAIWRQLKSSYSQDLFSKYSNITNDCKLAIYKFDASREDKLLNANNLGAFYKFINNKIGNKSSIPPLKNSSNVLLTSDLDRANLLNEYFQSVFTSDNGSAPHFPSRILSDNNGMSDVEITSDIVLSILKKLKTNSAAGPDGLPPIFFHHTAYTLSFPLSTLFRSLIDLRSIPSEWKQSIIKPKFKKGSPTDPSNYRPISLTCTCSKILESIISNQLTNYLLEHNLITRHQHGFLKRHSTSTNLIESLHDWSISLANNNSINIAYIDYKSAFDCISHPKLLIKLTSYGIKGNLYHWIAAFLSHRSQSVKINSSLSTPCLVTSGVPQGSVLGPLLFNLYVNDVTDHIDQSATAQLFADDIKLYTYFSNISPSMLQSQLDIIQAWSTLWQLRISYPKCSILTISHQQTNIFQIDLNQISSVDHVCDLGITIDSKLKFQRHIHTIISRANHRKSLILRCFLSRNQTNLVRAFKTYVRPILEYASTVWSPSYITDIITIERVQKDFTKRTPGCSHMSYPERLTARKLQSLEHRRLIADLTMVYNIIHDKISINTHLFTPSPNQNLRGHPLKLTVPLAKSNIQKHFFSHRVIPIWNSLPSQVVLAPSTVSFKKLINKIDLNKHLIFCSIYS